MDAITLVQTIVPVILGIIFSIISIGGLEQLINEKQRSVLTAVWCLLSMLCWFTAAVANVAMTTTLMFTAYSYLYIGLGFLFTALMIASIIINLQLAASAASEHEMDIE